MEGIAKYNPSILKTTHIEAFDAVVNELDAQNVMFCLLIMLVSLKLCCNDDNDNESFMIDILILKNGFMDLLWLSIAFEWTSYISGICILLENLGHEN